MGVSSGADDSTGKEDSSGMGAEDWAGSGSASLAKHGTAAARVKSSIKKMEHTFFIARPSVKVTPCGRLDDRTALTY